MAPVVGLLLIAGCTDPPAPEAAELEEPAVEEAPVAPTGARVGVVLPPSSEVDGEVLDAVTRQLAALADETGDIARFRTYPAEDARFAGDLAGWLAEQRTELVCVLGDEGESVVVPLAALYRDVRFCALPARGIPTPVLAADDAQNEGPDDAGPDAEGPDAADGAGPDAGEGPDGEGEPDADGVLRVEVRAEELGYLVGIAARAQASGGIVGLVLEGDTLPDVRFRDGLLAGLAGAEVIETEASGDTSSPLDRAEALLAAGSAVLVFDGALGAADAVAAIGDRATVFAPSALLEGLDDPTLALGWAVRWDVALGGPLASLMGEAPRGTRTSVGLAEGVFEVVIGPAARPAVGAVVAVTTEQLIAGTLDPLVPARPEPSEPDGAASSPSPP